VRALWDALWALESARARSPEHEARWLNLGGFLLRPGFGDPGDELRVGRLWRVLGADLRHPRAVQCRAEWWNLWKRIAGGLTARQQEHLLQQVSPALLRRGKAKGRARPQELREMAGDPGAASGSRRRRAELGAVLVADAERGRATDQELWALARLGARVPVYGPLNCVVARETAAAWAERLLRGTWSRPDAYAFALAQIARATGDRERDLEPSLRERVAARLEREPAGARAARLVREPVALEAREEARLLDEALPAGLRIRGAGVTAGARADARSTRAPYALRPSSARAGVAVGGAPRLHMSAIVLVTGGRLRRLFACFRGHGAMWLRYPLAVLVAWTVSPAAVALARVAVPRDRARRRRLDLPSIDLPPPTLRPRHSVSAAAGSVAAGGAGWGAVSGDEPARAGTGSALSASISTMVGPGHARHPRCRRPARAVVAVSPAPALLAEVLVDAYWWPRCIGV
jgi:hypothetical protein